ncbi:MULTISPECIES: hypothetical protein [unclassified Neorhizobium]|uniref:hypothetical protein n=1 Tax=unclassified Neorhizobium TaxID=2629175 RepID=UPI001FF15146|nr:MULTISPECIES: hypothetical protein [unclassified Neorhizobium]MCJ9671758.1 hypothetical protein [Neorhizobium sp. SHOUNA12B]MCJ9743844.1 hypothetical protein [Neorhizobium sp. SHOUNA12A]
MRKIEIGNEVEWAWGRAEAKGKTIKRKAGADEPAFPIRVLQSQSELRKTHG